MAEIGPDFRGGYYGDQVEPSGGGYDPTTQKPSGPLSSLYSNPYDFNNLSYPRNIGQAQRGHYINFYINVAENTSYASGANYNALGSASTITNTPGRTGINQANQAAAMPTGTQTIQSALTVRKTKRISQAIALYMPETVNVQYNASWQSESLTDAAGSLGQYGALGAAAIKKLTSNKTTSSLSPFVAEVLGNISENTGLTGAGSRDFALFTTGYALNPQLEVLFKGTEMRTFQFDFLFSPYDESEAEAVVNIIKTFKFHQAPEVVTDSVGRFFVPPSEFDIDFLVDGQINDKIHQIGTCVLTNINVDYAPNGWSTFSNGMPTSVRMTLQFMETEIVTKQRVEKDNY